jgi:hypothetical protein
LEYGCKENALQTTYRISVFDEKRKLKIVARVKKQIAKFDLTKEDFGFVNA